MQMLMLNATLRSRSLALERRNGFAKHVHIWTPRRNDTPRRRAAENDDYLSKISDFNFLPWPVPTSGLVTKAELGRKRKLSSFYPSHESEIMLSFYKVLYGFAVCSGAVEAYVAYVNNERP
jgi:hypothetical protein